MDLKGIKKVFFIGIGGIGMSALARYFHSLGAEVGGYDKTRTELTDELQAEGIHIIYEDNPILMPKTPDLVVYTPAIPKDHKGLNFYKDNKFTLLKRSEVLGMITKGKFAICVAGSHGKTTVSAMIAHILTQSGFGCSAFLGGIATNFDSNFIAHENNVVVVEADEFDRSFHRLEPDMAVITAVDTDHLDVYGTKENIEEAFIGFAEKIAEDGFLVIKQNTGIENRLPVLDKAFYSLKDNQADVYCSEYLIADGAYVFNIKYYEQEFTGFRLNIGGFHNIENAIAAFTIAKELKIATHQIKAALASFKGIHRRFEYILNKGGRVYIDDYAHHPEEIRVLLESVRELFPEKKITAVFQPHLFSRTKDLAEGFAKQLSIADEVILLEIYPARELPVEGVTSALIYDRLSSKEKYNIKKEELLTLLAGKNTEVLLTIGAGDIDKLVVPLKELLNQKNK